MEQKDRVYFARRAAEEQELAVHAGNEAAAAAHRKMQRAYLERALIGDRQSAGTGQLN
jgi:hypothetical protein